MRVSCTFKDQKNQQKALRRGGLGVCEEDCSEGATEVGPSNQNLKVV